MAAARNSYTSFLGLDGAPTGISEKVLYSIMYIVVGMLEHSMKSNVPVILAPNGNSWQANNGENTQKPSDVCMKFALGW